MRVTLVSPCVTLLKVATPVFIGIVSACHPLFEKFHISLVMDSEEHAVGCYPDYKMCRYARNYRKIRFKIYQNAAGCEKDM